MIKLIRLPGGGFDVAMDEGDDASAVATVVYALLYTDQRAPNMREGDDFAKRGWWRDPQAGSGLWHVRRQALDAGARAETVQIITQVLQASGQLLDVSVADASPPGSVSQMDVQIGGQHNGRSFLLTITL